MIYNRGMDSQANPTVEGNTEPGSSGSGVRVEAGRRAQKRTRSPTLCYC